MRCNLILISTAILCTVLLSLTGCSTATQVEHTASDLQKHINYLVETVGPRPAGSPEEKQAGDYIYDAFASYGYEQDGFELKRVSFSIEAPHNLDSENIIAVKKGRSDQNIVAVVAHYDSMPQTPGARDNAGGTAALLELSKILKDADVDAELRFIVLGAEEIGYWGASSYLDALSEAEKDRHIAVYNMDITIATQGSGSKLVFNTLGSRTEQGYKEGNFLEPAHNLVSHSVSDAYEKLGYHMEELAGSVHYGDSDHVSFHQSGIDAANICWRRVENGTTILPAEYHLPQDNLESLDYRTLEITVACIRDAILGFNQYEE